MEIACYNKSRDMPRDPNDPEGSSYSGHVMDEWEFMYVYNIYVYKKF
jgi:hypothetical protein